MFGRRRATGRPLPKEFLDWQVSLRLHTMLERNGSPHVGVAPILTVRHPGHPVGTLGHSIICGLLPRPELLEGKTRDFRELYEAHVAEGARRVYDRGIEYLLDYYRSSDDFDRESLTTLLPEDLPAVSALRADPRCALVFYVFDLADKSELGRLRCTQVNARAELLRDGPVYDNVWWHNALFHGAVEGCVVVRFVHQSSYDTRFGAMEELST